MNKCSRAVACAVALFCAVLLDEAVASPNPQNRMEMEIMQPEYVAAIAKELEKEGVAALKHQEENNHLTRSEFEAGGFGRNNKYPGHRKPEAFDARRLTETILYPAELIELSNSKRNFDEIDRTGFSGFNKRNFDEIDRTGFSGFNKRNFDEIDRTGFSGFNKRNFDEIDRTSFSGFQKRNFDEIDRSSFPGFNRKRNFDEIDRTGFSGFNKRNFDEIDRTGFSGFNKRSARSAAKLSAQRRR